MMQNQSIFADDGCTLAHFFISGEAENSFSLLRALVIGEDPSLGSSQGNVCSVLRLMAQSTDGKPSLLAVIMSSTRTLLSKKISAVQFTAFMPIALAISGRMKQMGPDFIGLWKKAWDFVAEQVLLSMTLPCSERWKKTGKIWADIARLIGKRRWTRIFMKFARIATILDKEHGNRYMVGQHLASKAAQGGVNAGFMISKGVIGVVAKTLPAPAAAVLNNVNHLLSFAEGVTNAGLSIATKVGVGATDVAMRYRRQSQEGGEPDAVEIEYPDDDDEDEVFGDDDLEDQ